MWPRTRSRFVVVVVVVIVVVVVVFVVGYVIVDLESEFFDESLISFVRVVNFDEVFEQPELALRNDVVVLVPWECLQHIGTDFNAAQHRNKYRHR